MFASARSITIRRFGVLQRTQSSFLGLSIATSKYALPQDCFNGRGRCLTTSLACQAKKPRSSPTDTRGILREVKQSVFSIFDPIYSELVDMGKIKNKRQFTPIFFEFMETLFPKMADRQKPEVIALVQYRFSLFQKYRLHHDPASVRGPARHIFYFWYARSRHSSSPEENKLESADMRHPHEWYPQARMQKRVIHLHVGPTNSGKTYHALKRLEAAKTGIYCGPLRLLAHEIYTRLNANGVKCSLLTGDERRFPMDDVEPPKKLSCTVEMAPMVEVDVAVVDEIQMIGSSERGWAWTGILLGSPAKEIHLCGETRAVPVVREIANMLGDEIVIHNYNRLSPLRVMGESLKEDFTNLRKGDCLVLFNVLAIHQVRKEVERQTGKQAAIIYGSLPPETRAQQARLFNDPDSGYDILIASDAIGMGLNLSIRRVIFYSMIKHDGESRRDLTESEIKQIAGRAGRYRPASSSSSSSSSTTSSTTQSASSQDGTTVVDPKGSAGSPPDDEDRNLYASTYEPSETTGWVTTFHSDDFPALVKGMAAPPEPIVTAGLQPPTALLKNFAESFPQKTPHTYILQRLQQVAKMGPHYHICSFRGHLAIADQIQDVPLSIHDRIVMTVAPAGRNPVVLEAVLEYAKAISENRSITILDLPCIELELLDKEPMGELQQLREMEALHQKVVIFLWLSFRFPATFRGRALAMEAKYRIEQHINSGLERFSSPELLQRLRNIRQKLNADLDAQAAIETVDDDEGFDPTIVEDSSSALPTSESQPTSSTTKPSRTHR